jgi:hypothetical protein
LFIQIWMVPGTPNDLGLTCAGKMPPPGRELQGERRGSLYALPRQVQTRVRQLLRYAGAEARDMAQKNRARTTPATMRVT